MLDFFYVSGQEMSFAVFVWKMWAKVNVGSFFNSVQCFSVYLPSTFFLVGNDYFRLHLSNIQYIKQSNKQTDAQPNQNTFFPVYRYPNRIKVPLSSNIWQISFNK